MNKHGVITTNIDIKGKSYLVVDLAHILDTVFRSLYGYRHAILQTGILHFHLDVPSRRAIGRGDGGVNGVVQDDRIWRHEVSVDQFRQLLKRNRISAKNLVAIGINNSKPKIDTYWAKVVVGLDFTTVSFVLKAVDLDIIPQGLNHAYAAIFFDPEHISCNHKALL